MMATAQQYTWYALTAAIYAMALYNCFRVLGSRNTPGGSIAWILFHLLLPVAAIPLFLLIGDFRIKGYVRRHRAAAREFERDGRLLPTLPPSPGILDVEEPLRRDLAVFSQLLVRFGDAFEPQTGSVRLLVDGEQTFDAIFKGIASARHYILVQYYILRSDRLGLALKNLLIEKAKAGVPVFMLLDDMGSFWLSQEYLNDLRRSGVRIARFLPISSFKRFFQLNYRNHRKLVIVDGVTAFTGGLNVGEEYVGSRNQRSQLRYWRDTHVELAGSTVTRLEEVFLEDWFFSSREFVTLPSAAAARAPTADEVPPLKQAIQVVPTGPTDDALVSILFVLQLINSARTRLWITTPYLVPDPALCRALELAAMRGVDVRLVIPRVSDNRFVHWVSLSYAEQLGTQGVKVLLYEPAFMHQKVLLVDDSLAAVGTMNLDNRAMYLNFETMILVHGAAFNASVAAMLEADFLNCRYLKLNRTMSPIRVLKRLRGNFARLFAPLL